MKLFAQIFLCMMTVFSLALCVVGYEIISSSFSNSIEREKNRALEEYELIKFSLRSGLLSASESGKLTMTELKALAQKTSEITPDGSFVAIFRRSIQPFPKTMNMNFRNLMEAFHIQWRNQAADIC